MKPYTASSRRAGIKAGCSMGRARAAPQTAGPVLSDPISHYCPPASLCPHHACHCCFLNAEDTVPWPWVCLCHSSQYPSTQPPLRGLPVCSDIAFPCPAHSAFSCRLRPRPTLHPQFPPLALVSHLPPTHRHTYTQQHFPPGDQRPRPSHHVA